MTPQTQMKMLQLGFAPCAGFGRIVLVLTLFSGLTAPALAADATGRSAADHRSRIIESSLRDLSRSNDAAITGGGITLSRGLDAQGMPRVNLKPVPVISADKLVEGDIQSSLHRLRRETASQRTSDDRRTRIENNQSPPEPQR